jgi:3-oxoacyl-(acyl-carrier-protein) synthase
MRRVALTGIGVVSPIGIGVPAFEAGLFSGQSGMVVVPEMRDAGFHCHVAARVVRCEEWEPDTEQPEIFARSAAEEAVADSGLPAARLASDDVGVVLCSIANGANAGTRTRRLIERGLAPHRVMLPETARCMPESTALAVSLPIGARGRVVSIGATCAGGLAAVGHAYELIQLGQQSICLAGGAEAFDPWVAGIAFDSWRALAADRNDAPEGACRPFDASRGGFVLGEGAAVFVLEELEQATRRRARIHAEIVGFALTNDGADMRKPTGEGLRRAIRSARVQASSFGTNAIDYVNPHGAGTRLGDAAESRALCAELGDYRPLVSSVKPLIGHCLGAAGALELAATLSMMTRQLVVPTRNLVEVARDCAGPNHVTSGLTAARLSAAMTMNMGLGGTNAALVLRAASQI